MSCGQRSQLNSIGVHCALYSRSLIISILVHVHVTVHVSYRVTRESAYTSLLNMYKQYMYILYSRCSSYLPLLFSPPDILFRLLLLPLRSVLICIYRTFFNILYSSLLPVPLPKRTYCTSTLPLSTIPTRLLFRGNTLIFTLSH